MISKRCAKAEAWLRAQATTHGWEKATKLQGRETAQGLIAVLSSPSNAIMLEMNCETDFVARNKKFQGLVQKVAEACFATLEGSKNTSTLYTHILELDELSNVPLGGSAVKDEVAISIGEIGENIQPRRALLVQASKPVLLSGYTHPAVPEAERQKFVQFGKYGAIVAYKVSDDKGGGKGRVAEIGRQLCQHVVGMNPTEIGSMDAPPPAKKDPPVVEEQAGTPEEAQPQGEDNFDSTEFKAKSTVEEDETVLLNQEFLLDPELTVREFLVENAVEVLYFNNFHVGQSDQSKSN